MDDVRDCDGLYGNAEVIDAPPSLPIFRECCYIPCNTPGHHFGLYDVGRRLITQSAYFRGPVIETPVNFANNVPPSWINRRHNEPVIYGGFLHGHFGHFLLSTFSRLWPYVVGPKPEPNVRIVVHTTEAGAAQFFAARPWATEMITSLGLSSDNFLTCYEPTTFREMLVPAPSFEELSFVHRAFAELCHAAGSRLAAHQVIGRNGPVYLSKERLQSGVRKVVNESEVTDVLSSNGVDIVFPELLSLAEQAALWRDRSVVISIVSSALHASIFAPGRRTVAVSDSNVIISNFALIDRVNHAASRYLGLPPNSLSKQPLTPEFSELTILKSPHAVARAILDAL